MEEERGALMLSGIREINTNSDDPKYAWYINLKDENLHAKSNLMLDLPDNDSNQINFILDGRMNMENLDCDIDSEIILHTILYETVMDQFNQDYEIDQIKADWDGDGEFECIIQDLKKENGRITVEFAAFDTDKLIDGYEFEFGNGLIFDGEDLLGNCPWELWNEDPVEIDPNLLLRYIEYTYID